MKRDEWVCRTEGERWCAVAVNVEIWQVPEGRFLWLLPGIELIHHPGTQAYLREVPDS